MAAQSASEPTTAASTQREKEGSVKDGNASAITKSAVATGAYRCRALCGQMGVSALEFAQN
jgi:hypothetical protein